MSSAEVQDVIDDLEARVKKSEESKVVPVAPKAPEQTKEDSMTSSEAIEIIANAASADLDAALGEMSSSEIGDLITELEERVVRAEKSKATPTAPKVKAVDMSSSEAMEIIANASSAELDNALSQMSSTEVDELVKELEAKVATLTKVQEVKASKEDSMTDSEADRIIADATSAEIDAALDQMSSSEINDLAKEVGLESEPKVQAPKTVKPVKEDSMSSSEAIEIIANASSAELSEALSEMSSAEVQGVIDELEAKVKKVEESKVEPVAPKVSEETKEDSMTSSEAIEIIANADSKDLESALSEMSSSEVGDLISELEARVPKTQTIPEASVVSKKSKKSDSGDMTSSEALEIIANASSAELSEALDTFSDSEKEELLKELEAKAGRA